ncbi:asparagine synthase (glutamine-hydrolyzing) [Caenispirillum salinarum]|uniref:asparagine synthase (glutamine-hydrolyzing) n=1 Tax=Caenispirillum salinarum TaxID=859058 RepID=UPI00384B8C46
MCGIVALSLAASVEDGNGLGLRMLGRQRHRGPDHEEARAFCDGAVVLGHNRLSINDLSDAGHQPISNEDGTVWAVVNGEIYNYPELYRELVAKGHRFRSGSDSEVLVHLYEEVGEALVERLHGMFAFVLLDTRSGDLLCGRDRLGKKPLVYAQTPAGVAVTSEIPAALEFPGVNTALDRTALGIFLLRNFRHVPDPYTIYRGVRRLPPGHCMIVRQGRVARLWQYWRPDFNPRPVTVDEVREAFDQAVSRRLMADVEIAAMLSGGVDSTAIVHAMQDRGNKSVATYALGHGPDDSELIRARRAAEMLGCDHQEFYFDPDRHHAMMLDLWRIHGEPIALLPLVYAYDLCQRIRDDGRKVVMTGHGADEIFYGYSGFMRMDQLSRALAAVPGIIARPAAAAAGRVLPQGHALREAALVAAAKPGRRKSALYTDEAARVWPELLAVGGADAATAGAIEDLFDTWIGDAPPKDYIDEAAVIGLMQENAHSVTIAGDLPAMAASVEVRCPFLDQDLVQLAWRIHHTLKVGGRRDTTQLKMILKQALEERLPHDLLYAPKQGFGYNIQEADVLSGPWKGRVDAALDNMGDLGGALSGDGVARLRRNFAAAPDYRGAITIAKLYSLAETVGS